VPARLRYKLSPRRIAPHDSAYLELVESYETAILNYIYRLVGDPEVARDLTQDTYVKAYQAREMLELGDASRDRRRAWLYRVAHNTATDHLRRQSRLRWLPLGRSVPQPSSDPEPRAVAAEAVASTLGRLSPDQREVLLLFLQSGLTAPEVAEVLGVSADAARKRLQRARAAFESAYKEAAPADGDRVIDPTAAGADG